MSLTREQLNAMSLHDLSRLRDLAHHVIDVKQGHCTACHGTGRMQEGTTMWTCEDCGGTGSREDQVGWERLSAAGYGITDSTTGDPAITTWLVVRPDNKRLPDHYPDMDAAWLAAKEDHEAWGTEGEDD